MKKRMLPLWAVLVLSMAGGCQQTTPRGGVMERSPVFYEDIVWMSLSVQMPYLDEDNDKKPDGVMVDVMLNRPGEKAFVAGRGSAVFHLIKRTRDPQGRFVDQKLYKWDVAEEDLTRSVIRQRFGLVCHHMALYWYGIQPCGPGLYLQAEFIRPDGKRVVSRMVSLTIPESPFGTGL